MSKFSWQWVQSFIAVVEVGSLSKAAQHLGLSQSTLSRQIAQLEKQLNMSLFNRSTQGLGLTAQAHQLVESAQQMQLAGEQFKRIASGSAMNLAGELRISVNEVIGLYYLPLAIKSFNQLYPEVQVEIEISNKASSLNKRDADIAIRMFRPTQLDLIAKRLPDIQLNFYASRQYLSQYGIPQNLEELLEHKMIGFDQDRQMLKAANKLDWPIDRASFIDRSDSLNLQIELAKQGCGISITHKKIIDQFIELQTILSNIAIPKLECWLVCHSDVQHNRRIRVMMDFLGQYFSK